MGSGLKPEPLWEQAPTVGFPSLGEYSTHSFGERPKEENGSRLSQILEDSPHPKYCLSEKACRGILTRANKRGKKLPEELENALKSQAHYLSSNEPESPGGGKGILTQYEKTGTIGASNTQHICAGQPDKARRVIEE